MSTFTQEEQLFILEVGWAKLFRQAGLELAPNMNGDVFPSHSFPVGLFANPERELLAYNIPIGRIIESQSIKDIQDLEGFSIEFTEAP